MLGVTVKAYPCHVSSHAVIEGVSRLRREQPFDAGDIEAVRVIGNAWMMEPRFLQQRPETLMGAQYSLPFTLSVALTRGLDDPRSMSDEALADPQVRALAERIKLGEDASRFSRTSGPSAELSIIVNGETRTIVVSDWKGAPSNPSTLDDAAENCAATPAASRGAGGGDHRARRGDRARAGRGGVGAADRRLNERACAAGGIRTGATVALDKARQAAVEYP